MNELKQHYARISGRPGIYLAWPPRCPVDGSYMPFRHALDMYVCRQLHAGRCYYVTWQTWQWHQGDRTGDPGFFADPVASELRRLFLP